MHSLTVINLHIHLVLSILLVIVKYSNILSSDNNMLQTKKFDIEHSELNTSQKSALRLLLSNKRQFQTLMRKRMSNSSCVN